MFEFILKYKNILLISGVIIILILGIILAFISFQNNTEPVVTNENINQLDYSFLNDQTISREDQFLMLQAKILNDEFGTYSFDSPRSLEDVLNQSTENFIPKVQERINSITKQTKVEMESDPETIELNRLSDTSVRVSMNALMIDSAGIEKQVVSTVDMVKQDQYWLVDDITFVNN